VKSQFLALVVMTAIAGGGPYCLYAYLFVVLGWSGHVGVELAKWPNPKRFHGDLKTRLAVVSAMKAEGLSK